MKGIRDLTSLLPTLLDPPAWRTPLPDVTELAPGWRRHDRTHLEISLEHPADGRSRTWEAWIFLPQSFRLDPHTYGDANLGSDIQSHIRFSAPVLELADLAAETARVAVAIEGSLFDDPVAELKVFACSVREAIARETFRVRMAEADDCTDDRVDALIHGVENGLTGIRESLLPAAARADPEVAKTAHWVDEHLSRSFEAAMIKIALDLSERETPTSALERTRAAAVAEARYRAEIAAGPSVAADSSTRDLERVERRQHALKRLTSAVLWLHTEARDARRSAEHGLHAIAAGIAMTFAISAAVLYGTPNDATDLWVWGGLVVLAYMGKDRLKAGLQDIFSRFIDRRYPNRRWIVRDRVGGRQIATATEKYRFADVEELPPAIARLRRELQRDSLGETIESDSILWHRKTVLVDPEAVRATDDRLESITEILRIDVSSWLNHTDDPSRTVTLVDPATGELFESALPRAYDVTILHRLGPTGGDAPWTAARVVVSRNGIRRVDQLDE